MPLICSVYQCKSRAKKGSPISFHSFPRDLNLRQIWLDRLVVKRKLNFASNPRVCSKHFKSEDFIPGGNCRKLKKAAIPSVIKNESSVNCTKISSQTDSTKNTNIILKNSKTVTNSHLESDQIKQEEIEIEDCDTLLKYQDNFLCSTSSNKFYENRLSTNDQSSGQFRQEMKDVTKEVYEVLNNKSNLTYLIVTPASTHCNLQNGRKMHKNSISISEVGTENTLRKYDKMPNNNINKQLNELDIFCENLAMQLKEMPLERALVCQEKIQRIITQEHFFQLSQWHG